MILVFYIGRILLGGYFIYSGVGHFKGLNGLVGYAQSKNVPFPKAAVILSGIMMIVGGLSVVLGFQMIIGMWLLVLFLIPTTMLMHNFWTATDPADRMNSHIQFFKNVALIGALFLLISIPYLLIN